MADKPDGDFKKVLDAEQKYKLAYFQWEDSCVKKMTKFLEDQETRKNIIKTHEELNTTLIELDDKNHQSLAKVINFLNKSF